MKLKYGPYSPSRLETGVCGYAFRKQYIEPNSGIKTENLPQARGSAMHEVFEKITKKFIESESTCFSETEVREWVIEAIQRHPAAYQETELILDMAERYIRHPPAVLTKDAGIEMRLAIKPKMKDGKMDAYQDEYDDTLVEYDQTGQPVFKTVKRKEERISFQECDYDDPEAWIRGRADILLISDDTTQAIIYDHKTQPNMEEANTLQMGIYAWVISRVYPFLDSVQTVLHFSRYGVYSKPYVWTHAELARVEDVVLTNIGIIESKTSWEATPHKNCQYCPFITQCPAVAEFMKIDESGKVTVAPQAAFKINGNQHQAVKIAGILNVLEDVVDIAKSELKEFAKAGNVVAIPGKTYEYRVPEQASIDWDEVNKKLRIQAYAIFEKHGVDPKDFMAFSQTASKGIWRAENPELVRELAELFPRKRESSFRGWTSKSNY